MYPTYSYLSRHATLLSLHKHLLLCRRSSLYLQRTALPPTAAAKDVIVLWGRCRVHQGQGTRASLQSRQGKGTVQGGDENDRRAAVNRAEAMYVK